eukprot:15323906-Ditylum_brightwellii.AAC.1
METQFLLAEERARESKKLLLESERCATKAKAHAVEAEVHAANSETNGCSISLSRESDLQEELNVTEKQLYETKSKLFNTEDQNRQLIIENAEKEMKFRYQLEQLEEEKTKTERDLRQQMDAMNFGKELATLRSEGKKKDDSIESLREQTLYKEDMKRELQSKSKDEEQGISDLRSMIDSCDETIDSLNKKAKQHQEELKLLNL